MKNCNNCGANIDEGAIYCPYCGTRYDEKGKKEENRQTYGTGGSYDPKYGYIPNYSGSPYGSGTNDVVGRSFWISLLSFVLPLVGFILWYVWRFTKPGKAASAAHGALSAVSFGTPIIGLAIWFICKYSRPEIAKISGISAIVGVVFTIILSIILVLLGQLYGIYLY
ncbi:MAG: zinc-ribbon domain-containing protein [Clostridia bacterium]|nr:zinc-ribbon domain-containing protein [Clostridia bacterium]